VSSINIKVRVLERTLLTGITLLPNSAPAWLTPKYLNFVAPSHTAGVGVGAEVVVDVSSHRAFTTGDGTRAKAPVENSASTKPVRVFMSSEGPMVDKNVQEMLPGVNFIHK
jgi:hypothetical protein